MMKAKEREARVCYYITRKEVKMLCNGLFSLFSRDFVGRILLIFFLTFKFTA